MPAESLMVVSIVTGGFILFMAALAWATWYDRQSRGSSSR